MPVSEPIQDVLLEFVSEFDEFGGFFRAGAPGNVVFDCIAFDAAAIEVVGIASTLVAQN